MEIIIFPVEIDSKNMLRGEIQNRTLELYIISGQEAKLYSEIILIFLDFLLFS